MNGAVDKPQSISIYSDRDGMRYKPVGASLTVTIRVVI
jgi:hypothetical protein